LRSPWGKKTTGIPLNPKQHNDNKSAKVASSKQPAAILLSQQHSFIPTHDPWQEGIVLDL